MLTTGSDAERKWLLLTKCGYWCGILAFDALLPLLLLLLLLLLVVVVGILAVLVLVGTRLGEADDDNGDGDDVESMLLI